MQEANINIHNKTSRVNLLSKVYILSVVMEPLLYFLMVPPSITGIGGNLGRLLQFIVIIGLCLRMFVHGRVRIPNPLSLFNRNYTYYFIFAVLAGCYGVLSGAYSMNIGLSKLDIYVTSISYFIHGSIFRAFFEYFITFYYYAYFVILAGYLISNKETINYFFKLFTIAFYLCILIGCGDLLLQLIYPLETYEGLPRHYYDGTFVGFRFHGIAGEPRDAFSYLMLGLGILTLRDIWKGEKKLTLFWVIIIAYIATLTQSMSGLIGIGFFCCLLFIYFLPKVPAKLKLVTIFFVLLAVVAVLMNVSTSARLMLYYTHSLTLYSELATETPISPVWNNVMNNVYPIWHLWLKIREFDFLPFIIGNGLGSVRVINNYYMGISDLVNPNAFVIRAIYETGVIGSLLFIAAFMRPLKRVYIDHKIKVKLSLFMLLMLGMYFAHKTAIPYIFFGIAVVVIKNKLIISGSTS